MARPKALHKEFIEIVNAREELELKQALEQEQRDRDAKQRYEKSLLEQFGKIGMDINRLLKERQEATSRSEALLRKLEEQFEYEHGWKRHLAQKVLLPKQLGRGGELVRPFRSKFLKPGSPEQETEIRNGMCWQGSAKSDNGGGFTFFDAYWTFSYTPKATRSYVLTPHITARGDCWMHSDNSTLDFSDDYSHAFIEIRTDVWTGYWRGEQVVNVFNRNGRNIDVIEAVNLALHIPRTEVFAARVPVMMRVVARFAVNSGGSAYCVFRFGAPNRTAPICCPYLKVTPA